MFNTVSFESKIVLQNKIYELKDLKKLRSVLFMKKLSALFISFICIISIGCAASRNLSKPTLDSLVVEMPGYKSNQLYESIQVYAAKKWMDPQKATKFADKSSQKLVVSGHLIPLAMDNKGMGGYSYVTTGVLTYFIKDNKFKVTLENASTITTTYNGYGNAISTDEAPGVMTQHLNILSQIAEETKESILKQKGQQDF